MEIVTKVIAPIIQMISKMSVSLVTKKIVSIGVLTDEPPNEYIISTQGGVLCISR